MAYLPMMPSRCIWLTAAMVLLMFTSSCQLANRCLGIQLEVAISGSNHRFVRFVGYCACLAKCCGPALNGGCVSRGNVSWVQAKAGISLLRSAHLLRGAQVPQKVR